MIARLAAAARRRLAWRRIRAHARADEPKPADPDPGNGADALPPPEPVTAWPPPRRCAGCRTILAPRTTGDRCALCRAKNGHRP